MNLENLKKLHFHLYIYDLPPLDWTFCFQTVKEMKTKILNTNSEMINHEIISDYIDNLVIEAENAAKKRGWDGEYRDQPLLFAIPGGDNLNYQVSIKNDMIGTYNCFLGMAAFGVIIKQDNDGVCYIYSPFELKHLES